MSQFAAPETYQTHPLCLKHAKGAYLYDTEACKYVDFSMGHGHLLLGHQDKSLLSFIKTGFSNGIYPSLPSLFDARVRRFWANKIPHSKLMLASNIHTLLLAILHKQAYQSIAVSNPLLQQLLKPIPSVLAQAGGQYDLLIEEHIPLFPETPRPVSAKMRLQYEGRSAFRFQSGLYTPFPAGDGALLCGNIDAGLGSCLLLLPQDHSLDLDLAPVPLYLSLALLEGVKRLERKAPWTYPFPKISGVEQIGSILRLPKPPAIEQFYPHGVFLTSPWLFLSTAHSDLDAKRLGKALRALG